MDEPLSVVGHDARMHARGVLIVENHGVVPAASQGGGLRAKLERGRRGLTFQYAQNRRVGHGWSIAAGVDDDRMKLHSGPSGPNPCPL